MIRFCRECMQVAQACNCPASIRTQPADLIDPIPGIERTADEVRMRILRRILDNDAWHYLVQLAQDRASSEGAQVYGNASYHKTDAELEYEGDCEIADLIFYMHVPVERAS